MSSIGRNVLRLAAAGLVAAATAPIAGGLPAAATVGGTPVVPADVPFAGRLTVTDCGATLISAQYVLTSASCATASIPGFDYFRRGDQWHSLSTSTGNKVVHPLWDGNPGSGHDVALLRLTFPATSLAHVQVGSPWEGLLGPGTPATIIGRDSAVPKHLAADLRVDTTLRSDAEMAAIHGAGWKAPLMMGAGTATATACTGDGGGPLLVHRAGRWIQFGVTSFHAAGCGGPAGFAELTNAQLAWVASIEPTITTAWGRCVTPTGTVGQTSARYVYGQLPGGQYEGRYSWEIECYDGPPPDPIPWPHPTPDPEPEPEPDPEDPPICRRRPWLCEDPL